MTDPRPRARTLGGARIFLALVMWACPVAAPALDSAPGIGLGELDRLLSQHQPQKLPGGSRKPLDHFAKRTALPGIAQPVEFSIPGFAFYGCGKCHNGDRLLDAAAERMSGVVQTILRNNPAIRDIPLRQYVIQTYEDDLLSGGRLAHATFDTVRIFPGAVLIDGKVYGLATHLHETLHLAQPFLGHVNELEAYGLNALADPRFLILNYPYFADVESAFFAPDFDGVLKAFFARQTRENLSVPREVQWFMQPFDGAALGRLAASAVKMAPLLAEVGRLNRELPLEIAYWSDQTGIPSLALDLAAVQRLDLPPLALAQDARDKAFEVLASQMTKTDNTRLGYVIDRKKESLTTLQYQFGMNDPAERLRLYFHYLKRRFISPGGQIDLKVENERDFVEYVQAKMDRVRRMLQYEGLSPIEREAGERWEETIKNKLSAYLTKKQTESSE